MDVLSRILKNVLPSDPCFLVESYTPKITTCIIDSYWMDTRSAQSPFQWFCKKFSSKRNCFQFQGLMTTSCNLESISYQDEKNENQNRYTFKGFVFFKHQFNDAVYMWMDLYELTRLHDLGWMKQLDGFKNVEETKIVFSPIQCLFGKMFSMMRCIPLSTDPLDPLDDYHDPEDCPLLAHMMDFPSVSHCNCVRQKSPVRCVSPFGVERGPDYML